MTFEAILSEICALFGDIVKPCSAKTNPVRSVFWKPPTHESFSPSLMGTKLHQHPLKLGMKA